MQVANNLFFLIFLHEIHLLTAHIVIQYVTYILNSIIMYRIRQLSSFLIFPKKFYLC